MLEETVVGEADEERRFAARGVAEEDLFLDLVVRCFGSGGAVSLSCFSWKRGWDSCFCLGFGWRAGERCRFLRTSRKEGKKASTVGRVKTPSQSVARCHESLARVQPLWGVRVGRSLDRLDVPEMRSFRTPPRSGSDSKLEAGAGSVEQPELRNGRTKSQLAIPKSSRGRGMVQRRELT